VSASKSAVSARLPIRRGLGEAEAALYIGLGASKFRELVEEGTMPRPRLIGTRRIWDIDDIDAAFRALPVEGETQQDGNPWHDA
jgi:excisionase family DNA binding protein